MTKKQMERMVRTLNRAAAQTLHFSTQLNAWPEIAQQVGAASDELQGAMRKLENVRDEMMAPVHP